jgi:prepilin-type N-terminal cleavage/methylation domain-containing protein
MKKITSQKGFTIIELLIASTILTTILVAASFILVQIGRLYYKGVITARTQDSARNIMEAISRPTQLEGANITDVTVGDWRVVCVGSQRFSFREGVKATDTQQVALKDTINVSSDCDTAAIPGANGVESLLANNMRISSLEIDEDVVDGTTDIAVTVAYGEDTELEAGPPLRCRQQTSSAQWCAVAAYSTRIFPRVGQE